MTVAKPVIPDDFDEKILKIIAEERVKETPGRDKFGRVFERVFKEVFTYTDIKKRPGGTMYMGYAKKFLPAVRDVLEDEDLIKKIKRDLKEKHGYSEDLSKDLLELLPEDEKSYYHYLAGANKMLETGDFPRVYVFSHALASFLPKGEARDKVLEDLINLGVSQPYPKKVSYARVVSLLKKHEKYPEPEIIPREVELKKENPALTAEDVERKFKEVMARVPENNFNQLFGMLCIEVFGIKKKVTGYNPTVDAEVLFAAVQKVLADEDKVNEIKAVLKRKRDIKYPLELTEELIKMIPSSPKALRDKFRLGASIADPGDLPRVYILTEALLSLAPDGVDKKAMLDSVINYAKKCRIPEDGSKLNPISRLLNSYGITAHIQPHASGVRVSPQNPVDGGVGGP